MNFQLTFIEKKIYSLDKVISDDSKEDNGIINKSIKFFLEYLLNTDCSFRDEKYESNIPIKERQDILFHFNIVELINKSSSYQTGKKYFIAFGTTNNSYTITSNGNSNRLFISRIKMLSR